MSCTEFEDVASELALGILYGEERAAALAHLETCHACRREVTLLTDAADEIRLLVPEVEPPAGFEQRVVARIAAAQGDVAPAVPLHPRRPRPYLRPLVAVAAVAAVMFAIVGSSALLLGGHGRQGVAEAQTAPMRTNSGEVVGDATLSTRPDAILVELEDWAGLVNSYGATVDAPYWLAIEDGQGRRNLRRLPPADQHPWTVELHGVPDTVTSVSIVDDGGTVWCTAHFV
ncbi:MAG TPA: hypothetical protein VH479_08445 [Acidimicrobiales bacterium]